jgi:murein DD-endopeptidase MepM/ murein hydrolase activator NlpD
MLKYPVVALLFVLALSTTNTKAQTPTVQSKTYPQNIFRYPLDLPPSTAGGFGELRGNHFHSGLDFRTNQREGYPVHAVYDGYISRLRVQFGGFGNALYITHPNGYTSVYGHLQRFSPEILQVLREQQRIQQKDLVDISLDPMQLPVYKGQIVAWSGNTGGSAGPHLHFELRDSETEQTINAQLFGLTIPDQVPPTISAMAVYKLNGNPFSDKTAHNFYPVAGTAGHYHLVNPQVLEIGSDAGLGIACVDQNSASANRNGAYAIEVKLDGTTIYTMVMERFAFDQTHAINAYIDYPTAQTTGRMIQKCFMLPGSKITIYPQSINRGIIKLTDDAVHDVEYVVKDVAGNTSTLAIKVKAGPESKLIAAQPAVGTTRFHYDQTNVFTNDNLKITIAPGNLYDDLDFTFAKLPKHVGAFSATYRLHNRLTPIHDQFDVWIKPDSTIGALVNKAVIVGAEDAIYEDGYVKAHAKGFGDVYVRVDTEAPFIHPLNIINGGSMAGKPKISFKIGDNLSGIKSYLGKIDGQWVLMEWDFKTKLLNYTFDTSITPGKHKLELTVTDNKDNAATYTAEFYR